MSRTSFARRAFKLILPLVVLAGGFAVFAYLSATRPQLAAEQPPERVWTVDTVQAELRDHQPDLILYGQILSPREVELRPLVEGRVAEVAADLRTGALVDAGQPLLTIDPFDYETALARAEADLAEARAALAEIDAEIAAAETLLPRDREQVALRRTDLARREELRQRGAGAVVTVDDARLALLAAQQQLAEREASRTRLAAQRDRQRAVIDGLEVARSRAERNLADTRLVAPFDALVLEVSAELGKRVSLSDPVARLADRTAYDVRFHVSTAQYGRILAAGGPIGRSAQVTWRVEPVPLIFSARIDRADGRIDASTGGVNLYARIREGEALDSLRPGAFVEVRVPDRLYRGAVRLPEGAWRDDGHVYVAVDGRLEAREVELLARVGGDVVVRGDLAGGEEVVTTPLPEVAPGVRVAVR